MNQINNCVFCRIIKGELPSNKVYEDQEVIAFTPKETQAIGHTLIIPKEHYLDIFDIPEKSLEKVIAISKKLSLAMKKGLNAKGVNILHASGKEAQQSVFHFHIHLIPRYDDDGIDAEIKKDNKSSYNKDEINMLIKGAIQ